jgi:hypothetical protein
MDYYKYIKYKSKYLKLKTLYGGNYKIILFSEKGIIIDSREILTNIVLIYGKYEIHIKHDTILITYNNDIVKLNINIPNVIFKLTDKFIINLENVTLINVDMIYKNNNKKYDNIKNENNLFSKIFHFDDINETNNNILDICAKHLNKFRYVDELMSVHKLISSTICNELYTNMKDTKIYMNENLILFIYDVMYQDMLSKINVDEYIVFSDKLIKKFVPVFISPSIVEIKNQNNIFEPLSSYKVKPYWKIMIDTGNSSYTKISYRLLERIEKCEMYKRKDICIKIGGINGTLQCNKMIRFPIMFYGILYIIYATVDDSLEDNIDILFGHKTFLDLFFTDNFAISTDYNRNELIDKFVEEHAYIQFVSDMDKLISEIYDNNYDDNNSTINATFSNNVNNYFVRIIY